MQYGAKIASSSTPVSWAAKDIENNFEDFKRYFQSEDQENSVSILLALEGYIKYHSDNMAEAFLNAWKANKGLQIDADIGILDTEMKFTLI